MPITALPVAPTRSDPVNFNSRADAFLSALPTFATEANALQADVNAKQTAAATSAAAALASENAANAASNASAWVSGTTYAIGNVRYSPITFLSYRRKTAGAGTTDPSADSTNWQLINGTGNVDLNSTQTLTNKEIGSGSTVNGVPVANLVNTTANQTVGGNKTFSGEVVVTGTFVDSNATEAQLIARKTGTSASDTYLFNNSTEYGIFDSSSGALISRNKSTGVVSISGNATNTINAAIAGSTVGTVGTYAFCRGFQAEPGSTYAGSSLNYTGGVVESVARNVGGGTWRAMGYTSVGDRGTLYLRIA